jgi:hypothetical protein
MSKAKKPSAQGLGSKSVDIGNSGARDSSIDDATCGEIADSETREIFALVESTIDLARRAVEEYAPAVDSIIHSRSRDVWHIEHTLDGLLDFCFDDEALVLYKKLCRHYFDTDAAATASYINDYRELWDSEPEVQA